MSNLSSLDATIDFLEGDEELTEAHVEAAALALSSLTYDETMPGVRYLGNFAKAFRKTGVAMSEGRAQAYAKRFRALNARLTTYPLFNAFMERVYAHDR